jgi:hypothetical protein
MLNTMIAAPAGSFFFFFVWKGEAFAKSAGANACGGRHDRRLFFRGQRKHLACSGVGGVVCDDLSECDLFATSELMIGIRH